MKEQASNFGGAMGNIAAATGLVKKDEFPTDMNVFPTHTRAHITRRISRTYIDLLTDASNERSKSHAVDVIHTCFHISIHTMSGADDRADWPLNIVRRIPQRISKTGETQTHRGGAQGWETH